MSQYTQIDLIRHGMLKTPALFCAAADEPLSENGFAALESATKKGHWDIIISSPYERCQAFAKQLASLQSHCELHIEPAFQEMDFGKWIGIPTKTLWQQEPQHLTQLWQSPETFAAPSGETMTQFIDRIKKAWCSLLKQHNNKKILLITHAGVIRAILSESLTISHQAILQFEIKHAHLSRLHYYPDNVYSLQFHGLAQLSNKIT